MASQSQLDPNQAVGSVMFPTRRFIMENQTEKSLVPGFGMIAAEKPNMEIVIGDAVMQDNDKPSPVYAHYRERYPVKFMKEKKSIQAMHTLNPERDAYWKATLNGRLNPVRISKIFSEMLSQTQAIIPDKEAIDDIKDGALRHFYCSYKCDSLIWQVNFEWGPFYDSSAKRVNPGLCIRLANDGFLYPAAKDFFKNYTDKSTIFRHKCDGWVSLSLDDMKTYFTDIQSFAQKWLGTAKTSFVIWYNEENERVDFQFRPRLDKTQKQQQQPQQKQIRICFEPGFPDSDFKDEWIDSE